MYFMTQIPSNIMVPVSCPTLWRLTFATGVGDCTTTKNVLLIDAVFVLLSNLEHKTPLRNCLQAQLCQPPRSVAIDTEHIYAESTLWTVPTSLYNTFG